MGLYSRDRPMWELTAAACQKDDTTLIDQALSKASQHDDINDLELLNEFCALAVQHNSANVLTHLIKQGASIKSLKPGNITWRGPRTKPIMEILLAHGWDINARDTSRGYLGAEPFMWSVVTDIDLVTWCLEHGASVYPRDQEPLRDDILTMSQRKCQQILEKAAYSATVATFELLRSKGAPLGWRPLHRAIETTTHYQAYPGEEANRREEEEKEAKESARKYEERMAMVRHLVDVVGIDVNAPDEPPGAGVPDRWGTPICYIAKSYGLETDTRELAWFLLDRGADPTPALEIAKSTEHQKFVADVEAWRAQQADGRKCCAIQ
ncbi:hypothetical protein VE03_04944 [Pseudogymnoascus sp. 23342-1-I1]|nr:hypothetical protein VE03_04944 [Pseudogymnoascus sp. 23342-1-I1]